MTTDATTAAATTTTTTTNTAAATTTTGDSGGDAEELWDKVKENSEPLRELLSYGDGNTLTQTRYLLNSKDPSAIGSISIVYKDDGSLLPHITRFVGTTGCIDLSAEDLQTLKDAYDLQTLTPESASLIQYIINQFLPGRKFEYTFNFISTPFQFQVFMAPYMEGQLVGLKFVVCGIFNSLDMVKKVLPKDIAEQISKVTGTDTTTTTTTTTDPTTGATITTTTPTTTTTTGTTTTTTDAAAATTASTTTTTAATTGTTSTTAASTSTTPGPTTAGAPSFLTQFPFLYSANRSVNLEESARLGLFFSQKSDGGLYIAFSVKMLFQSDAASALLGYFFEGAAENQWRVLGYPDITKLTQLQSITSGDTTGTFPNTSPGPPPPPAAGAAGSTTSSTTGTTTTTGTTSTTGTTTSSSGATGTTTNGTTTYATYTNAIFHINNINTYRLKFHKKIINKKKKNNNNNNNDNKNTNHSNNDNSNNNNIDYSDSDNDSDSDSDNDNDNDGEGEGFEDVTKENNNNNNNDNNNNKIDSNYNNANNPWYKLKKKPSWPTKSEKLLVNGFEGYKIVMQNNIKNNMGHVVTDKWKMLPFSLLGIGLYLTTRDFCQTKQIIGQLLSAL